MPSPCLLAWHGPGMHSKLRFVYPAHLALTKDTCYPISAHRNPENKIWKCRVSSPALLPLSYPSWYYLHKETLTLGQSWHR